MIAHYDRGMLDAALADRIADTFGLGRHAVLSADPVARGEQGQVWLLTGTAGRWAVKEFYPVNEDDIRFAADFADAARARGVPNPRQVRTIDGGLIAVLGGQQVRVSQWVDLLAPDLGLDPAAVGRVLAAVHRTDFAASALLDPWFTEPVGRAQWDELRDGLAAAGAPFADQFAAMRDELVALDEWVRPPGAIRTCHRDLWADNLLPTAAGGVCVIDWDDCGPADPSHELACLLVEFGGDDPVRIGALYRAYRENGGPGRVNRRGDFSMLIAQLGHICQIACRDWLDPAARSVSRSHSAQRFDEFVVRPTTRARLETILDSVR